MSYPCSHLNKKECDACGVCKLPNENDCVCSCCENKIKDEFYYVVNDNVYCKDCLDMNFRFEKEDNE